MAVNSECHPSEKAVQGQKRWPGHYPGAQVAPGIRRVVLSSTGGGFIQGVSQTRVVFHLLAACVSGKAQKVPRWSGREAYPKVQRIAGAWAARQV